MNKIVFLIVGYTVTIIFGNFFVSGIYKILPYSIDKKSGIKYAGMVIGFLERFIILTFVLLNKYSAIAFIFTAKSIARFEELKNRDFSEYYLVGTLSSVSFAILCCEIMKFLLKTI